MPIVYVCVLSCYSCVQLFVTLWNVACQAPLSMELSRQEYWSGLPCPAPRDLPHPGIEPGALMSPALVGGFFTTSTTWEAHAYRPTRKKKRCQGNQTSEEKEQVVSHSTERKINCCVILPSPSQPHSGKSQNLLTLTLYFYL